MKAKGDFGTGSIPRHILRLAVPILLAEFVHVLYNIVDRMFIGHIPEFGTLALGGVGVVFPLITFTNAFASFFQSGAASLCSIARGEGDEEKARNILETSIGMILLIGIVLMLVLLPTMPWTLRWMGADDTTYGYAAEYFSTYLLGTVFVLLSLGANQFINIQGNAIIGMFTVLIGAVTNILLDPILIFTLGLGVRGAAIATVISQGLSAAWVMVFLCSRRSQLRVRRLHISREFVAPILRLGVSGFCFKMTNSITQAVANVTLRLFGGVSGTLYIGAMSIINSTREVTSLPISAISSSTQPILGFNYGARKNSRVCRTVMAMLWMTLGYATCATIVMELFPEAIVSVFTPDLDLLSITGPCLRLYYAAFFMMAFQTCGQHTFVSLNCPKRAVFFSLLRKVILVVPLTLILPRVGFGVLGVFLAEAVSQLIGASATMITMVLTVFRKVKRTPDGVPVDLS